MKTEKAVQALSALAQENRLSIYLLLLNNLDGLPAGDIADNLNIPATTLSFHLSQLKNASLIEAEKQGRSIIYSCNKKKVKKLAKLITGKLIDSNDEDKYKL